VIRFSIRRPVAVAMLYLGLAVLGVVSWVRLPVELLPRTELPRLRVTARWPGAGPEATEALLTSPIEAAVQQVRGVARVESVSEERNGAGISSVDVQFTRGTNLDFARLDLSERLAALEEQLPSAAGHPVVEPYVPAEFQAQRKPFLLYTLTGPYTAEALRRQVDEAIAPDLRRVAGVADVQARGGRARLLEVALDPARVLALGLDPERVRATLASLELVRAAGSVSQRGMRHSVAIRARPHSLEDVRLTPLLTDHGRMLRLRDVAVVRDGWEPPASHYRIDGRPAVSFEVYSEAGTNVVRVADRVKARLAETRGELLPGTRIILDEDESAAVRSQLSDLRWRAASSALVVLVVLFVFLRSFLAAAIVFSSIAFAVLITFNLIYLGGLTLNLLTLMGLAMGFGVVIDNGVVVLENIHRRARTGELPADAAERGAREVVLPVLAATATNVIVFVPFVYLQGEARLYYLPLALVVGLTNLASLFAAFSFTPALAARLLPRRSSGEHATQTQARWYVRGYARMLGYSLRHPWVAVGLPLLLLAGSGWLFQEYVTRGTVWRAWWDEASYLAITIDQPRGEELATTDALARRFEHLLHAMPEVARFTTRVYPQAAEIRVDFPDSLRSTAVPVAVKGRLEAYSRSLGGSEVQVAGFGPSFQRGGATPPNYSIRVLGYNYEEVRRIGEDLGERLRRFPRIRDVDTNASGQWFDRDRATEVVVGIDRRRLAMHSLSARDVVRRVAAATGGDERRGFLRLDDEEVLLSVGLAGSETLDVLQLRELPIPARSGEPVRLGEVAAIGERDVLSRIVREDQQYQRTVAYEFSGPPRLGNRVQAAVIAATHLPAGYRLVGREDGRWGDDEQEQIYLVLGFALLLVFMVCAALFESLRQPLCVLLTVPMALIGVFLVYFLTNASFSREGFIGVIMMSGVVVNNAVLLIDRVNEVRRHEGLALHDAVVRGSLGRVRPILMTSAVTIIGLLPLVLFSPAADANIWNALGFSLLGGLASSTVLVLTVTPALYLLFERGPERRRGQRERSG
jgi:hydrophobic/amphiphilic exporter-1 (mainly G- bacteria), HAE1 family